MKRVPKLNTRREIIAVWFTENQEEYLDKPTCPSCRDILIWETRGFFNCLNQECKITGIRLD